MSDQGWGTHPRISDKAWIAGRFRKSAAYFRAGRWPPSTGLEGNIENMEWANYHADLFEQLANEEEGDTMNEELLSDCCGVPPEGDGCEEAGICPCCHEHCEFVGEEEGA